MERATKKQKLSWRIKVVFSGNLPPKEYMTPDIRHTDPGWGSELFNRVIERIEFYLPTGHRLILAGMEQYNFFIEAMQDLSGRFAGKVRIQAFWFCGKLPGKDIVEMWKIGDKRIVRAQKPWGREWRGHPTKGWKKGVSGQVVSVLSKG